MKINVFVLALASTPRIAQSHMSPLLASRQVLDCGSQPVDCGGGWCCLIGNICQPAPNNGFVCIDQLLTQSDGTPFTNDAYNPSSQISDFSSIGLTLTSNDIPTSTKSSSAPATPTAKTTSSQAVPSTIVPTSGQQRVSDGRAIFLQVIMIMVGVGIFSFMLT